MSANATAQFLLTLGQALAAQTLYAAGHPMRIAARDRVHATLSQVLSERGALRVSFLDGSVVIGRRVMHELRGWEWAPRLSAAGVQRLEVDAVPAPTPADVELFLAELQQRLSTGADHSAIVALRCFRFGPLTVATKEDEHDTAAGELLRSLADLSLDEESSAIRWIHDEIAGGCDVPMAEVEAVVHSLAMAIHREQHLVMPLLDIKSHDEYTTAHSCNVSLLAIGLAESMGLSAGDVRAIGMAALLYDIGKVRLSPELLAKPGVLTAEERLAMQQHTVDGARILGDRSRGHALAATVAYEHHLWENGEGGYPRLHWPRRTHFASRIVHVCDVYDALCTMRPYREAWSRERAAAYLVQRAGIEFDPEVVRALTGMLARVESSVVLAA